MNRFWMIYCEGGHSPNVQHATLEEAKNEAARICRANAAKGVTKADGSAPAVYVLEPIRRCRVAGTLVPLEWEWLERS